MTIGKPRIWTASGALDQSAELDREAAEGAAAILRDAAAGAAALQAIADEADRELRKHISPIWDRPKEGD